MPYSRANILRLIEETDRYSGLNSMIVPFSELERTNAMREMQDEIDKLMADKARLDYILRDVRVSMDEPRRLLLEPIPYPDTTLNARPAIDAAIKAS